MAETTEAPRTEARDRLWLERLKAEREEAIRGAVAGRDTLCIMPTVAGESAIRQIAGLLTPGATIIVSSLPAPQRDQSESIERDDVAGTAEVNSPAPEGERRDALSDPARGELEFLFVAPEELSRREVLDRVRASKPSLFVVDEAHCVSQWDQDFRPVYLKLGEVIDSLRHPTVLALTATASPQVREDIVKYLHMREPRIVVRGFDRPNIWLGARAFGRESDKLEATLSAVTEAPKPGIVYVATRKDAESLALALEERDVSAVAYHAGLKKGQKEAAQSAFMSGAKDVIVATSAFGMGIDKPDLRFVFHYHASDSLDSYHQEIGRAGRDGGPARAVLFYRPQDLHLHRFFAGGGRVGPDELERVVSALQAAGTPLGRNALAEQAELSRTKVASALAALRSVNAIDLLPNGDVVGRAGVDRRTIKDAARSQKKGHENDLANIEIVRGYAEGAGCRRNSLLRYFGEESPELCGYCDNCESGRAVRLAKAAASSAAAASAVADHAETGGETSVATPSRAAHPFPIDTWVIHRAWGKGVVTGYHQDKVTVAFEKHGVKTLSVPMVIENSLLEPAAGG